VIPISYRLKGLKTYFILSISTTVFMEFVTVLSYMTSFILTTMYLFDT